MLPADKVGNADRRRRFGQGRMLFGRMDGFSEDLLLVGNVR
jgi:hypothetical protein